jgi:hypothetical protein
MTPSTTLTVQPSVKVLVGFGGRPVSPGLQVDVMIGHWMRHLIGTTEVVVAKDVHGVVTLGTAVTCGKARVLLTEGHVRQECDAGARYDGLTLGVEWQRPRRQR